MTSTTPSLPTVKAIQVDTRGALILDEESPETRDSRGIYLPNYVEPVSHIAVDVRRRLVRLMLARSKSFNSSAAILAVDSGNSGVQHSQRCINPERVYPIIFLATQRYPVIRITTTDSTNKWSSDTSDPRPCASCSALHESLLRRVSVQHFPGGSLNFERFETEHIDDCVQYIQSLIERSAQLNGVSIEEMRQSVKIMATGGGAHRFYELFGKELQVEVRREDEMECLIEGLKFITLIPDEAYYFSDELIHSVSHPTAHGLKTELVQNGKDGVYERPSPDPPKYAVTFESNPTPQLPCLLVNIGSGVSIIKVDEDGSFERVSGTSLGGGTLWGLLSLLTPATTFDEMLDLSEKGDNATVDMLVGDIYGQDYSRLGLKSTMIASSFGKVFSKKGGKKGTFSAEDISKSLLYAVSNNIGQIAYMNAEKYNLDRIYFGGCFIRGHAATISTLSYAIRFWSKGTKRALFLRHEGFLGAIGAWIKNFGEEDVP
ncbi:hypothetical protein EW026_g5816 [Hermanssonia centrifuga]|uniref:Pantothenate kinase n=1 Tax=Hermanssonia centrifuga TaxID=98765 RepID=A0A4S4KHB4_9APHY|nr:hypothetical protein EW026_g5816 [Hermanssonia centrifuga]